MKELREKNLYPGDQLLKQYLHAQFSGKKRSEPNICFILQTALYYKFVDRNQTLLNITVKILKLKLSFHRLRNPKNPIQD